MRQADWYFDFISPFSYFGLVRLDELRSHLDVRYRPVLFAGWLSHWGQKGPAEIESKRIWTYRSCMWTASQLGIPFRFPAVHPFNPLAFLRLSIAADNDPRVIRAIYDALWTTGADPSDPALLTSLAVSLGIDLQRLAQLQVKDALRTTTEEAVGRGVFGVPTLIVDEQLFWGADATDFVKGYLADPAILATAEMQRLATLPAGAVRKRERSESDGDDRRAEIQHATQ